VTLRVVTALPDRAFEADVMRRLSRADSGATVVRRCLDAIELRSVAGARLADVAVVDLNLRGLDRDVVAELHAQGLRVIGTAAPDSESAGLGADAVVPEDAELVFSALRGGVVASPVPARSEGVGGRVVAVWGPVGSPGRTTVAVTLADELSRLGVTTLLADADTYGPSIAQHLALLDDSSGLAAVCRLAAQDRLDLSALARTAVGLPSGLRVLTGVPRSERWDELRPAALDAVWQRARELVSTTVVDVGFCLEHDDLAWFEPGVLSRNQAAVATLAAADVVVAVSGAEPVGLVRYLRALPAARALAPTARIEVVVNRVSTTRGSRSELRALLASQVGSGEPTYIPDDPAAVGAAMRTGRTLAEVAARSGARRAIQSLAERLGGVSSGRRRRRAA
jgi:MinD-like ATPase involved in chromosome partitioning or flagellar assembly